MTTMTIAAKKTRATTKTTITPGTMTATDKTRRRDKNKKEKGKQQEPVEAASAYLVEVECQPLDDASTACAFTGIAPEGAKGINHLELPVNEACAEVVGGDFQYLDPDPHTNVTGYASREDSAAFTLVLEGEVVPGGMATYWIKAASEIFPATGPGLVCNESVAASVDSTPVATQTEVTTGSVTVSAYACTAVPADTSAFDWFGACEPGGEHRYILAPVEDGQTDLLAAETDAAGVATFDDLVPGTYDLDQVEDAWCHAESNNVNAGGDVLVEVGQETSVWLFSCDAGAS